MDRGAARASRRGEGMDARAGPPVDQNDSWRTAMIKLSAFRSVPPFAQGLVRDVRVRWALEEAGIPYQERLIGREDRATPAYRALQPFGQVPAIETDELK